MVPVEPAVSSAWTSHAMFTFLGAMQGSSQYFLQEIS